MSTANTYNTILEGKTGYDAIKEFEEFIKNTHGDIFKSKHIGTNSNINPYQYEQLLIKAKNDLNVPTYIINTFKPFNSFNFYFFDDFYIGEDSDNQIICHYINLINKNNLSEFDISRYADIIGTSNKLSIIPISDQFLNLDKENETITVLNRDVNYNTKKSFQSNIPKQSTSGKLNKTELVDDRHVQIGEYINPIQKNSFNASSQHINIYSPDSPDYAIERFKIFKDFFINKIDNIQIYETSNCLPDWCQFGKLYNLDIEDPTSFIYTPINIVNIFIRNNIKQHYCSHLVRYSMLKFIDDDVDSSFWKSRSV